MPHRYREEFLRTLLRRHARLGFVKPFFRIEKGGEESGEEVLTIQLIENLQRQDGEGTRASRRQEEAHRLNEGR